MHEINKEHFGAFLACLRKQKGWTQKELAQKLFVSDKAVSKWERGLSLPDITLLSPLAELLSVTTTELLHGQRIAAQAPLSIGEVEKIVAGTLELSAVERSRYQTARKRRLVLYPVCVLIAAAEILFLMRMGYSVAFMQNDLLVTEFLCLFFGAWICFFAPEKLPAYYDENRISTFSSGIFRMNLAGISFNNSNWPHILRAGRVWLLGIMVVFPAVYFAATQMLSADLWQQYRLFLMLPCTLCFLIPMILAAKQHE